ncbi:rod shape-determining protein MreC [Methylovulum psychrotolerans]|uniref:Cell shape-determining protein MreC n=1 Tax=Methylovulum psychrotolerans TaxID=1704499 RepID=A0A1Z4C4E8_9GAMM|nr:rod shape-determining protein MreC [Methylovulum psychrotolerans]
MPQGLPSYPKRPPNRLILRTATIKLLFATGPSINTRLLVAVIASVALLVTEQRGGQRLDFLRAGLSLLIEPLKHLVDMPSAMVTQTTESMSSYTVLKKDNERLREEQLIQQTRLLKLEALEKENIRLRALLENSFKLGEQVLIAELLSIKMAPYEHILVVNKGTRFGVHPQQPVLDANGVVGQVFRALPLSSEIMLITDPNHAIPVQVNRNGLLTIAVGSGELNRLLLPFLPSNADIRPGDLLITSGLGGTFPQGYPVATVDEFTTQPNKAFASITATPTAKLDRNRELMIVWSKTMPVPLINKSDAPEPTPSATEQHHD